MNTNNELTMSAYTLTNTMLPVSHFFRLRYSRLKCFLNPKKEVLTFSNIVENQWILDENNRLCQIIKLDERIRPYYPNERTFTYKIYKNHNCWTSVSKSGEYYKKYILNNTWVPFFKFKNRLNNLSISRIKLRLLVIITLPSFRW